MLALSWKMRLVKTFLQILRQGMCFRDILLEKMMINIFKLFHPQKYFYFALFIKDGIYNALFVKLIILIKSFIIFKPVNYLYNPCYWFPHIGCVIDFEADFPSVVISQELRLQGTWNTLFSNIVRRWTSGIASIHNFQCLWKNYVMFQVIANSWGSVFTFLSVFKIQ